MTGSSSNKKLEPHYRYQNEIQQMMYVFGESLETSAAVTQLVEDIARYYITHVIINGVHIARRRSSRFLTVEDVIFLVRRSRSHVNRLKEYLSWKDVRKNVKAEQQDQKSAATAVGTGGAVAGEEDVPAEEDSAETVMRMRRKVKLGFEYLSSFMDVLDDEADEEADEEDLEAQREVMHRLKNADEITRAMTQDEYMFYSDCRMASFTHRKTKRFRDWTNMAQYVDSKPNDDVVDILGFLCYEMVRELTETSLSIKREADEFVDDEDDETGDGQQGKTSGVSLFKTKKKRKKKRSTQKRDAEGLKRQQLAQQRESEERSGTPGVGEIRGALRETPLTPEHVQEAFRRLLCERANPLLPYEPGVLRRELELH